MFGKVLPPVDCSAELVTAPGASDNLLALFCIQNKNDCLSFLIHMHVCVNIFRSMTSNAGVYHF